MRAPTERRPAYTSLLSAPQPEAVDAGARVLADGGGVVDAAIAAAFVQGVVDPLMCGIGGMGVAQVVAPDGTTTVLDGLGASPLAAREDMWADRVLGPTPDGFGFRVEGFANEAGALAVMTPGTVRMLGELHARFGTWPWADLLAPAIDVARSGWLIRPHIASVLMADESAAGRMDFADKLALTADGRRIYGEGGRPRLGQTIVNPELADTLTQLAARGAEDLYSGELASAVADAAAADGGILTIDDLRGYRLEEMEPVLADYRGLTVSAPPAPAGGFQTLQTLGILSRFDLSAVAHNSPEHVRILAEAFKHALRDKEALWARPSADRADYEALLDPAALDAAAASIRAGERADVDAARYEPRHTTQVSAMDADGRAVSLTHTLGSPSGWIPAGTGFMLNGGMSIFDPRPGTANSIAPLRRRQTTMTPAVVLDGTAPVMAIGAPGASWITPAIVQALSNVVDFGMPVDRAVAAPRIAATSNAIDLSNRIPTRTQGALAGMGYEVRRSAQSYAFAAVHAVTRFDGELTGGADPQRDGYADGARSSA